MNCHAAASLLTAALAVFGCISSRLAGAADYSFQILYDQNSNAPLTGYTLPSINDFGVVAFLAGDPNDSRIWKIVAGSGGPVTTIASRSTINEEYVFSEFPAINNNGQVEFAAKTSGVSGVFRGNGTGSLTNINGFVAGDFTTSHGVPAMNDADTVVFGSGSGRYVGDGNSPPTPIPSVVGNCDINNSGTVVWNTTLQVKAWNNGVTTIVDSTAGQFSSFLSSPGINAQGHVIFCAELDGGGKAVAIKDGSTTQIVASTQDGFPSLFFGSEPGINNSGDFVFASRIPGGGSKVGIYVGSDPVNDLVVYEGMSFAGGTIQELGYYPHGFNNAGQIAFAYFLGNGVSGIAVATPVPEPAAFLLFLGAAPLLVQFARRRRLAGIHAGAD